LKPTKSSAGNAWPADKVERRTVSELIPYARNARTHSDEQVAQIAASIQEWGWTSPVLVDEKGSIIAGHGRVMAARKLGFTDVPVMVASGWTDTQKKAYVLADNKLALNAGWDAELLKLELSELQSLSFDVALTGFSDDELAQMLADKTEGLTDPDEVPDTPARAVTAPGDVWLLGKHRIRCGDSTVATDVEALLAGERAGMVFTDPPYGVEYQSNMRTKSRKFDVLENDDRLLNIAPIIEAFSSGWVFVWTSWKVQTRWIAAFAGFGYPTNIVIWHKPGGGIGDLKRTFSSDYEVALVWHRSAELCGKRIGSVWTINKDAAASYLHPTQKPVALAQEAIDKTTRPDALVLDLFSGSGSTLIACEMTGRRARLMELSPEYVDVAVKRWQDFTGQKAILESNGRTFEDVASDRYSPAKDGEGSYIDAIAAKREELEHARA
jgi:DNA modification methylase